MGLRKANFAGSWYPGRAQECEREILSFLEDRNIPSPSSKNLIGGIVPHAGWYFSGSIACNVIRSLRDDVIPDVIVIFGMHLHENSPRFIMKEGAWQTPFGELKIADDLSGKLIKKFSFTFETAENYSRDNTIELQLPFIKYFFKNVKVVTIGVPPAKESLMVGEAVAEIAAELGLKLKVIGSTDLTHYGYNYGFVAKGTGSSAVEWVRNTNDRRIIDAMLGMEPATVIDEAKANQNACCAGAAATAIACAKHLGATRAESIAYATSYDKSPGDSFVGYVGIVFA
ncbi:MAG: AmmeMemoRadiSam system protein B [Desulfobacterales bacterium]|jgi:AmmeMemoRadiSam system protein B